jgi:hypothetical protein
METSLEKNQRMETSLEESLELAVVAGRMITPGPVRSVSIITPQKEDRSRSEFNVNNSKKRSIVRESSKEGAEKVEKKMHLPLSQETSDDTVPVSSQEYRSFVQDNCDWTEEEEDLKSDLATKHLHGQPLAENRGQGKFLDLTLKTVEEDIPGPALPPGALALQEKEVLVLNAYACGPTCTPICTPTPPTSVECKVMNHPLETTASAQHVAPCPPQFQVRRISTIQRLLVLVQIKFYNLYNHNV